MLAVSLGQYRNITHCCLSKINVLHGVALRFQFGYSLYSYHFTINTSFIVSRRSS